MLKASERSTIFVSRTTASDSDSRTTGSGVSSPPPQAVRPEGTTWSAAATAAKVVTILGVRCSIPVPSCKLIGDDAGNRPTHRRHEANRVAPRPDWCKGALAQIAPINLPLLFSMCPSRMPSEALALRSAVAIDPATLV